MNKEIKCLFKGCNRGANFMLNRKPYCALHYGEKKAILLRKRGLIK